MRYKRHLILECINGIRINNLSIKIPENKLNLSWEDAQVYCETQGKGWRLPTYNECYSILKCIRDEIETVHNYNRSNAASYKYPFLLLPPCWTSYEVCGSDLVSLVSFDVGKLWQPGFRLEDSFYSNDKFRTSARFIMVRNC
tara:strand:+ start:2234 stop:2659 length:426 start_codon:yes stop_codon:yes gene_type:complete